METCLTQPFVYNGDDFVSHVCRFDSYSKCQMLSKFDLALRAGWTAKMCQGLFRYHLGDLQTRILPGALKFVAQLNIQRGTERRKPQEILSIQQHFDEKQFNFNKINPQEIIFEMRKKNSNNAEVSGDGYGSILVVINVSPLEFGHCLFIPDPAQCLPQVLVVSAIQTGIEAVLLSSDPGFRVGFNSLGGFASVNHLHLHGYYLDYELRIEFSPTEPLIPELEFHRLIDFPSGFLFYTTGQNLPATSGVICLLTDYLVKRNIAHNLFFTRGCSPRNSLETRNDRNGVRVIVWPRRSIFGAKEESAFNVALCELAGHLPFKSREEFEVLTESDVKRIIQKYLLPDEDIFQLQTELIKHLHHNQYYAQS